MDAGDIYRADLNEEVSRRVLVVSVRQFHRLSGRALVVPEFRIPVGDVEPPWHLDIDGVVFAVDMLRSVTVDRLVERDGRCPAAAMANVRRVLQHIT